MAVAAVAIVASALVDCQLVAGIESRTLDPLPPSGCAPFVTTDADAQLRIANLVPGGAPIDACIAASGSAYFQPLLRDHGDAGVCRSGLAYPSVTAHVPVPVGAIDLELIAAGGTCTSPALAELKGLPTSAGGSTTVVLSTDSSGALHATSGVDDSLDPATGVDALRFANFLVGSTSMVVGEVQGSALPQTLEDAIVDGIPFGGFTPANAPASVDQVDGNGFLQLLAISLNLGFAEHGADDARFIVDLPVNAGTLSIFAIGSTSDLRYPARGLVCDDAATTDDGLFTKCTLTDVGVTVFDQWNAGLYGAFAPDEDVRRPYVIAALAARPSDVMCITEIDRAADRAALIEAAKQGGFAYSMTADTTAATPPTDPTEADGTVPSAPTVPPCGGTVDPAAVDKAYQCMVQNCSDATGVISGGTSCLSSECTPALLGFYVGSLQQKLCFDCMISYAVSYVPYAQAQTRCTTEVGNAFAFDGQTPSLILSKHPLLDEDTYVFASTSWRRAILYAQVQLDPTKPPLDYFCAQLSPYLTEMPYTGAYSTQTGIQGWEDEQVLETKRLIAWVAKKAQGRPAVVSGDWVSSPGIASANVAAQNQPVADLLAAAFTLAMPAGATPACTDCPSPENPYNGAAPPLWDQRVYLSAFPSDATQSATRFFTNAIVPLPDGTNAPPSEVYGWSVGVLRP